MHNVAIVFFILSLILSPIVLLLAWMNRMDVCCAESLYISYELLQHTFVVLFPSFLG